MFSRDFGRPKGAKFNIYLGFEDCGASVVALSLGRWWCPLGAGGAGCRGFRWSFGVFRPFRPLSYFALVGLLANMPLFRIFRGF